MSIQAPSDINQIVYASRSCTYVPSHSSTKSKKNTKAFSSFARVGAF